MRSVNYLDLRIITESSQRAPACRARVFPAVCWLTLAFLLCAASPSAGAGITVDGVVCTVDGIPILRSEMTELIGKKRLTKKEWDIARHELIVQKLLERVAREEKIEVTKKEVEQRLADRLREMGIERDDVKERLPKYRREMRGYLIKERVIVKKLRSKVVVLPAEVKAYYDEHKEEYRMEEKRRIRMMSVLTGKSAEPEAARKAAAEKIEEMMRQLKEDKDFVLVARRESNDPYAAAGGDCGWKKKGDLIEALDKAAFSLEVGHVSDIIETPQGFHIIKVEERQPEYDRPFNEVEDTIRKKLVREVFDNERAKYLNGLLENVVTEIYDEGPKE